MIAPAYPTRSLLVRLAVFILFAGQLSAFFCSPHNPSQGEDSIDGVAISIVTPVPAPYNTSSKLESTTLEVLSSTPEPLQKPSSLAVPILMYHHIGALPSNADAVRRDLTVSAENFEAQMALLTQKGYTTTSLEDLVAAFEGTRQLPPKPIILTFDDGYKDNFDYAYPVLKKYGFKGTFFIVTSLVGAKGYLTWDDIGEMAKDRMFIEAHGSTHVDLTLLSNDGIAQQVTQATESLQSHLNVTPRVYCYPAGKFNQTVINILREKGYRAAVSTRYGCVHYPDDLFQLRRVRISGSDSLSTFNSKIEYQSTK